MALADVGAAVWEAGRLREWEQVLGAVLRGKPEAVRLSLVCLLGRGHLLLEDVPGVGKTTLAHALARSVHGEFQRVQFTADMLPSDVLGMTVFHPPTAEFDFRRGPIFTNFLLADEINRATPKTQSALLEAMNEAQVTVDGVSHPLPQPFMVIATQNPAEHHGAYPLPESQLDRFLLRLSIGYPDKASERQILRGADAPANAVAPLLDLVDLARTQQRTAQVRVDDSLVDYMIELAAKTRSHPLVDLGVSPRGAKSLYRAAQALALLEGRDYVLPDDIKRLVGPVFAHRLVLKGRPAFGEANFEQREALLKEIGTQVPVPL